MTEVSNPWKNGSGIFQPLEHGTLTEPRRRSVFPNLGKWIATKERRELKNDEIIGPTPALRVS